MMNKNLRLPLFGLLGVAIVGLGAAIVFSGGKDDETLPSLPENTEGDSSTVPASAVDVTENTPLTFGDAPVTPLNPAPATTTTVTTDGKQPAAGATPPAAPAASAVKGAVVMYDLKKGEVLSKVAQKFGCKLDDIYKLNPGITAANAGKLQIGTKLKVRDNKGVGGTVVESGTVAAPAGGATTQAPAGDAVACEPAEVSSQADRAPENIKATTKPDFTVAHTHKVKRGDGYFTLSQKYYGANAYWRRIRDANPHWDPSKQEEGVEISIPALKPTETATASTGSAPATVERGGAGIIPPMPGH